MIFNLVLCCLLYMHADLCYQVHFITFITKNINLCLQAVKTSQVLELLGHTLTILQKMIY